VMFFLNAGVRMKKRGLKWHVSRCGDEGLWLLGEGVRKDGEGRAL